MARFRTRFAVPVVLLAASVLGCAERDAPAPPASAVPGVQLTADDRAVWRTPARRPDAIPVLLYHGVAERQEFGDEADAFYGVTPANFAKQMALLDHAGYSAITLDEFRRFHAGEPVDLPDHPVLITFDDGRADAQENADRVLEVLGWSAVMFVDVGAITDGAPGYATWEALAAMQRSGRWSVQLHAGRGHHNIRYGDGPLDVGPFYAYRDAVHGETLAGWKRRVTGDLEWGEQELRRHVPGYEPLAFAPPYGAYGQLDTNAARIPRVLGRELRARFGLVFVQDDPRLVRPGDRDVQRLQLDRTITGGDLHAWLATA